MRRLTLDYLRTETGAGLILIGAAAAAVALANSPWAGAYAAFVGASVPVRVGGFVETLSVAGWVRNGLMAVFFMVVGMGLKFELTRGELVGPRRFALPALAAAGGLIGPTLVWLAATRGSGAGWPAALATDSAVALAVLGVVAPGLAPSLRVLLMSVAMADNLAAATAASAMAPGRLHPGMVIGALTVLALMALMSRWRRAPFFFYAAGAVLVWGFALKSGLDAPLSGAVSGLTVPVGARRPGQESTLKYFMDSLHPYVAFGVLPLFVFTASGVRLSGLSAADLSAPAGIGLAAALWLGKPAGVVGLATLGVALRLARRPSGAQWLDIAGVGLASGAGFTVSLYVLDAGAPALRTAVLIASAVSLAGSAALLGWAQEQRRSAGPAPAASRARP